MRKKTRCVVLKDGRVRVYPAGNGSSYIISMDAARRAGLDVPGKSKATGKGDGVGWVSGMGRTRRSAQAAIDSMC